MIEKDRGHFLAMVIRKSPYSITTIAQRLGISRATLYNKFKTSNVDYDFLLSVGEVLREDIRTALPEVETKLSFPAHYKQFRKRFREKQYINLLEDYRKLFVFLTKVAHHYGLEEVKAQIDKLIETNSL